MSTKPKDLIGFVRITKAPDPMWIGVEGPLRHRMSSEPMIKEGMLVFGAVSEKELKGGPHAPGGYFFSVDPEGDPAWEFELVKRFAEGWAMKKNDIHHLGTELIRSYKAELDKNSFSLGMKSAMVIGFTDGINKLYRAIESDPRGVEP